MYSGLISRFHQPFSSLKLLLCLPVQTVVKMSNKAMERQNTGHAQTVFKRKENIPFPNTTTQMSISFHNFTHSAFNGVKLKPQNTALKTGLLCTGKSK